MDNIKKKCSKCKNFLEYYNFSKNRYKKDGYSPDCKSCKSSLNYKIECECGAKIGKYYKKLHEKIMHKNYIDTT